MLKISNVGVCLNIAVPGCVRDRKLTLYERVILVNANEGKHSVLLPYSRQEDAYCLANL